MEIEARLLEEWKANNDLLKFYEDLKQKRLAHFLTIQTAFLAFFALLAKDALVTLSVVSLTALVREAGTVEVCPRQRTCNIADVLVALDRLGEFGFTRSSSLAPDERLWSDGVALFFAVDSPRGSPDQPHDATG